MLRVETELHLALKVAAREVGINDLADWGKEIGRDVSRAVIAEVLRETQERHWQRVRSGEVEVVCARCGCVHGDGHRVVRRGSRSRRLRTSSGVVVFRLVQLTCRECGGTWSPFAELLGLAPRQRVSEELLKRLFEGVIHLSYAKTVELSERWLGGAVTARTLHRAVQERGTRITFTEAPALRTIVADGTRVKTGPKKRGKEFCVAFQIEGYSRVHRRAAVKKRVVGFGIGGYGWESALRLVTPPKLIVTDGEQGLRECVKRHFPRARHQLCEWHVPYTFNLLLLRDGGVALATRKQWVAELRDIIGDRDRKGYRRFTRRLKADTHARAHLERAEPYIMYEPQSAVRTSSWAERQMRELNRRTDVGVNWSMQGVSNLLKLRLAKLHNHDDYERIWSKPNPLTWKLVPQT
jgi:hypothetical protein